MCKQSVNNMCNLVCSGCHSEKNNHRFLKIKSQNVKERKNPANGPTQCCSIEESVVNSICSFKSLDLPDTFWYVDRTICIAAEKTGTIKYWHHSSYFKTTLVKLSAGAYLS